MKEQLCRILPKIIKIGGNAISTEIMETSIKVKYRQDIIHPITGEIIKENFIFDIYWESDGINPRFSENKIKYSENISINDLGYEAYVHFHQTMALINAIKEIQHHINDGNLLYFFLTHKAYIDGDDSIITFTMNNHVVVLNLRNNELVCNDNKMAIHNMISRQIIDMIDPDIL